VAREKEGFSLALLLLVPVDVDLGFRVIRQSETVVYETMLFSESGLPGFVCIALSHPFEKGGNSGIKTHLESRL
jgi:hypothetical protein